jgi:phage terminase small subunit|tara:strand:- start:4738 stop:5112 length:375 start_codon:yes stop_codon:yes gene_type:complete
MPRELTEKQRLFLDVLFDKAQGSIVQAKKLAGYSDGTSSSEVVRSLKDEINEATREYLARVAPKAAFSMANVLDDPTELGIKEKIVAAKDLLDRTGHAKTEKMEVSSSTGLFILPPKDSDATQT